MTNAIIVRLERYGMGETVTTASATLARWKSLGASMTLALLVVPLGVVAHVSAFVTLPMQIAMAMLREVTRCGGTDVRALLRGLCALALRPSLAAACAAEMRDGASEIREISDVARRRVEEFRKVSEEEGEKFRAACARLKEEAEIRERLREQLKATREELRRERAANESKGIVSPSTLETGNATLFFSTAALGIMLLYFHDIDAVHNVDKKLAAFIPALWMFTMTIKAQSVRTLCVVFNFVATGYFAHILLENHRLLGAVARTVA